jgi:hypothetical protein
LPTVNAGPNLTIPYGTSVTISGASASGIEPLSYFWSPPSAFIDNTILNPTTINLTSSALYTLTVTDGNGCSNEDRIIIIISGSALSVIPTALDTEICLGQSTQLFANASGGTGNYSYSWSSDPIGFSSNQAEIFSQVTRLKEIGLDVPQVTELAYLLRTDKVPVRSDILTVKEMVDHLCQLI